MSKLLKSTTEYLEQLTNAADRGETALFFLANALLARAKTEDTLDEVEIEGVANLIKSISHDLGEAALEGRRVIASLAESAAGGAL